jgi:hypothetical protein
MDTELQEKLQRARAEAKESALKYAADRAEKWLTEKFPFLCLQKALIRSLRAAITQEYTKGVEG